MKFRECMRNMVREQSLKQKDNKAEVVLFTGPIVRINPDEVHCTDPNFIDEIYPASGRKRNKPYWHVKNLVGPYLSLIPLLSDPSADTYISEP